LDLVRLWVEPSWAVLLLDDADEEELSVAFEVEVLMGVVAATAGVGVAFDPITKTLSERLSRDDTDSWDIFLPVELPAGSAGSCLRSWASFSPSSFKGSLVLFSDELGPESTNVFDAELAAFP
jgi:hypothetical protein